MKSKIKLFSFIALLTLVFGAGCTTAKSAKKAQAIRLGMSKADVQENLGPPTVLRGAIVNKYGQNVEEWEYLIDKGKTGSQRGGEIAATVSTLGLLAPLMMRDGETANFWAYFADGKLVQWGQAGDWSNESKRIYEVRFGAQEKL